MKIQSNLRYRPKTSIFTSKETKLSTVLSWKDGSPNKRWWSWWSWWWSWWRRWWWRWRRWFTCMRLSDLRPMHRAGNAATAESPIQEPLTNKNAHLLLFKSPTRALSESATGAHGESPIQEYSFFWKMPYRRPLQSHYQFILILVYLSLFTWGSMKKDLREQQQSVTMSGVQLTGVKRK